MKNQRISARFFTLIFPPTPPGPGDKPLKVVVNRQVKGAVERNRVKRVVREFFRKQRSFLPSTFLVCIARPHAGKTANPKLFEDLEQASGAGRDRAH